MISFFKSLNAPPDVLALVRSELERNPGWSFATGEEYRRYISDLYIDAFKHIRGYAPVIETEEESRRPSVLGRNPPENLRYFKQATDYLMQMMEQSKTQEERAQILAFVDKAKNDPSFLKQFVDAMDKAQQA